MKSSHICHLLCCHQWLMVSWQQAWKKFFSPAAGSQNQPPTKNALNNHHFKGSRKFQLQAAAKLFRGLLGSVFSLNPLFSSFSCLFFCDGLFFLLIHVNGDWGDAHKASPPSPFMSTMEVGTLPRVGFLQKYSILGLKNLKSCQANFTCMLNHWKPARLILLGS